jgi:3'-5' exonuclease
MPNKLTKVVLDIETVGKDFNDLDPIAQETLEKEAERKGFDDQAKEMQTSLSPLTGEVVVIGLYNPDSRKGQIYYQNGGQTTDNVEREGITYIAGDEKAILTAFWQNIRRFSSVITFNGRSFDVPYLLIRSAVNKIKPTRNLLPNRYASVPVHIDLKDLMTFYQGWKGMSSLHFFCKAFGIPSPKEGEISGYSVKKFYQGGDYMKIAEYNLQDLKATAELYRYWEQYLR